VRKVTEIAIASVRNATEPATAPAHPTGLDYPGGEMDTLIDIAILLSVYAGLSLFCAALMRALWAALPQRSNYESVTARGW
jgi:hypothetical protein